MTSERTSLDHLTQGVVSYFRRNAARYGLKPAAVGARYILNWGGYVNASFLISDGERSYHLKLADDEEVQEDLRRWQRHSRLLSERYHAPGMLDWVQLPRLPFAGPLFEFIPGRPADLAAQPHVLEGVLEVLQQLHADSQLAQLLEEEYGVSTCADYFLSVYIDRFDEDLRSVAGDLPPFLSLPLLDWMMAETRELEGLARDLAAFQEPAVSPTHGDLWPSNILVTAGGDWHIIDWDDLALGDPALEYSIVLGPFWRHGLLSQADVEGRLPTGENLRERFRLCLRALLLDEVIDTLADWVEAGFAPDYQVEVRAEKERRHHSALALYQKLFSA